MGQTHKKELMAAEPFTYLESRLSFLTDRKDHIELSPQMYSMLQNLADGIALASLTFKPAGYTVVIGAGNTLFRKHRPRLRVTNEAPVPVYTVPPVPVSTGQ